MPSKTRSEEIMDVAAELFCERGFPACSIRDIGDAAGVTSAALYYHFRNKDELLRSIIERGLETAYREVELAAARESTPTGRLRAAIRAHLCSCLDFRNVAAVIFREFRHLEAGSQQKAGALRDRYEHFWDGLLQEAAGHGAIPSGTDLHLLRLLLLGGLNSVLNWYRPGGGYRPDQIAEAFLQFVTEGIQVPGQGEAA